MELLKALAAPARSPDIPESADLYGWLAGSWDLDVIRYGTDVSAQQIRGEAHFGWTLEGRAVQDLWMFHAGDLHMHGTTLRVWDPAIEAWRVTWIAPSTSRRDELIGRRVDGQIVQVGTNRAGTPIRWLFHDVTPDTFRWTGEVLEADGKTWKLEGEFRARRRKDQSK